MKSNQNWSEQESTQVITCQHQWSVEQYCEVFFSKQFSLHVISNIALLLGLLSCRLLVSCLHGLHGLHGLFGSLGLLWILACLILRFLWHWPCLMHHVPLPQSLKEKPFSCSIPCCQLILRQGSHQWWYPAKPSLPTYDTHKWKWACMHDSKNAHCYTIAGLGRHFSSSSWTHWSEMPWQLSKWLRSEVVL